MRPNLPRRKPTRLRDYDYSQPGAYFVTVCAQHRKCLFGAIVDEQMQLNAISKIVVECWNRIPQHFPSVGLGESVIMPNHIHGIITCNPVGAGSPHPIENTSHRRGEVPSPAYRGSPSLGKIVAYFKYQSTKYINQHRNTPGTRIWQRNYHDHIIRDDADLQRIHQYIQDNPMKWALDQLHPDNPSKW
ncbi:MAG: transposase [Candidatus Poribacteria bacterium]|nr:transposase [Candidatus Poribacteria bacterium]